MLPVVAARSVIPFVPSQTVPCVSGRIRNRKNIDLILMAVDWVSSSVRAHLLLQVVPHFEAQRPRGEFVAVPSGCAPRCGSCPLCAGAAAWSSGNRRGRGGKICWFVPKFVTWRMLPQKCRTCGTHRLYAYELTVAGCVQAKVCKDTTTVTRLKDSTTTSTPKRGRRLGYDLCIPEPWKRVSEIGGLVTGTICVKICIF